MNPVVISALFLGAALVGCTGAPTSCTTQLNARNLGEIRYVTLHNTYHIAPANAALDFLREGRIELYPGYDSERAARELAYSHPPLEVQLNTGIRAFELDVWNDPEGGRFSDPAIRRLMPDLPAPSVAGEINDVGLKTLHIPDFDYLSQCPRFIGCLTTIAAWHRAHPGHMPIFILLEAKEGPGADLGQDFPSRETPRFDDAAFARLHEEILSVFPPDVLILPSEVSGNGHWPRVGDTRGRIAILLFDYGDGIAQRYAGFAVAKGIAPLLHLNDRQSAILPTWRRSSIPGTMDRGEFPGLIYTKADTTNLIDRERWDQALASSANFLATDYPALSGSVEIEGLGFNGALVSPSCED